MSTKKESKKSTKGQSLQEIAEQEHAEALRRQMKEPAQEKLYYIESEDIYELNRFLEVVRASRAEEVLDPSKGLEMLIQRIIKIVKTKE